MEKDVNHPFANIRPGRLCAVMITCHKSGLPVSTGIATGDNTDLASRYLKNRTHCSRRGEDHEWSGKNAFFGD